MKKSNFKRNNGITLVALVITIILLLILAGITISSLTSSGLFKAAQNARTTTDESTILEKIKLSLMNSRFGEGKYGEIDLGLLEEELVRQGIESSEITKGEGGKLPWKITHNGFTFEIKEDGTIEKVNGISLNKTVLKLMKGANETLVATKTEGLTGDVEWSSSNTSVATVDNAGKVTVVGESGSADITASISGTGYSTKCTVTVAKAIAGVKIVEPATGKLEVGVNATGTIKVAPTNNDSEEVVYTVTSSDTSNQYVEATVSGDTITVKGKATTSSDITLTIEGKGKSTNISKTVTATVTVTKKLVSLTAEQIKASPKTYYGKEVKNYTAGGLTYRIFYVDENNKIYLKGDDKTSTNLNDYANYDATNTLVRELNPEWATKTTGTQTVARGKDETNWNENEKAAAWLCSPVKIKNGQTINSTLPWANYFDSTKAEYVIGGPSVEMYVKSYNQTHDKDANGKDALGYQYQTTNTPGYIYKVFGEVQNGGWYTNSNTIDVTNFEKIYGNGNYLWLASPSAYSSNRVCRVNSDLAYLASNNFVNTNGLSPLVSLQSGINVQVEE